jgi:hypothetical protein
VNGEKVKISSFTTVNIPCIKTDFLPSMGEKVWMAGEILDG